MAFTTYTLSGPLDSLLGDGWEAARRVILQVESSQPLVADPSTSGGVRVGKRIGVTVDSDGAVSIQGIPATVDGAPLYRLHITASLPGAGEQTKVSTGWFEMTANRTLAWVVANAVTPVSVSPTLVADFSSMKADAETAKADAEAARVAAEAARDAAVDVSNIDTSDDVVEALIVNPALGPKTSAALSATIEAEVAPIVPDGGVRAVGKGELTFNVLDFGAVSGGTGDDTPAFQAAVDAAAPSAGIGAEVYIPPGAFHVTNVVVPDNVKIRGAGQRASKVTATASGAAFQLGSESVLSDFYITGSKVAGGEGVRFRPMSKHSTLQNMSITGHITGVVIDNSFIIQLRDASIQACTTGLRLTGTTGCNIVRMSGGEIQGCTDGVHHDGQHSYGLKFIGTTIEGNSGRAFKGEGTTFALTFRDCYFEANVAGSVTFPAGNHYGSVVDGCYFGGAGSHGVNAPDGINVRNITIRDNTFGITTSTARAVYLGTAVQNAHVALNHYAAAGNGPFDPTVDFLGLRLVREEVGKLSMRPSAATVSAGGAPLNLPHGTAPTAPANGDVWTTTAGFYVRINGVTLGTAPRTATTAQLTSATDPINTTLKTPGVMVFNTTTFAPVWARGPSATSAWCDGTGTIVHTPA